MEPKFNGGPLSRRQHGVAEPNGHVPDAKSPRPGSNPYLLLTRGGTTVDLIALARAAGHKNLPATHDQQLAEFEDLIVSEHVRQHLERVEATRGRLDELESAFGALADQLPTPRDLATVVEDAAAGLERELGDERALVPERQTQQQARRDLNHFVDERGLNRPAHYPQSRRLHLAWVAILATAEALANAAFFAGASSIGLIGGSVIAVVTAALNTGTGVIVGFSCLRGVHHPQAWVRRLSALGVSVYAVFVVIFNVAVGRARDLATTGTLSAGAFTELLRHPFDISLVSTTLVAVGLFASAVALYKGRSLDDVVPGYGDLDRRFAKVNRRFDESAAELRGVVLGHVERVPEALRNVVSSGEQIVKQLENVVVDAGKELEAYEADVHHLATSCAGLLRRVRGANVRVRTIAPPKHFDRFPEFSMDVSPAPLQRLKARLVHAHAGLDELKSEAYAIRGQQAQRVKSAAARFESFVDAQLIRAEARHVGESVTSDVVIVDDDGGVATDVRAREANGPAWRSRS